MKMRNGKFTNYESLSMLSSLILSNLKHELLNRLRSTMAANVLKQKLVVPSATRT
jgi:hypothetical protein